jgi:UDP-N-acetylglucosamine/UDP-N-acetylgalactosamine diphosphorylase
MSEDASSVVEILTARGVRLPRPEGVFFGPDVDPDRIAPGVTIHPGGRILGAATSIGPGSVIGAEGPATVEDCQLGRGVELKGGYFSGATFLDGANMGSCAHVRPGTLLEEEASAAHAVGFKQTILFPFAITGSLINFCDVLLAGGTSRKDHSEVGSSYIHFNYTPHGDKATASLLGDVPRGVFLDRPRIFLGGQGGLVGPVRTAYGTVVAAGRIQRKDLLTEGQLVAGAAAEAVDRPFVAGAYLGIARIVRNNLIYAGNLLALRLWYRRVRAAAPARDAFDRAALEGARRRLDEGLAERLKRLGELAAAMPRSLRLAEAAGARTQDPPYDQQRRFAERWPEIESALRSGFEERTAEAERDAFLADWSAVAGREDHVARVRALPPGARARGAAWLQAVVDAAAAAVAAG